MANRSILYVIPAVGGTAPSFALPRLCCHGDVHALLVAEKPPLADPLLREACASARWLRMDAPMPVSIVEAARGVRADAIVAFSETAIVAVARACEELGLRGPGPNVVTSRDKVAMRQCWQQAGLPIPAFVPVSSLDDLRAASRLLARPFLLKPSWLAGSLAQVVIDDRTDLVAAWSRATAAHRQVDTAGVRDFLTEGHGPRFIAEELIEASTESWYDVDGFGDYVSVEGVVAGGRYHPVSITARMPTVPPFVELGFHVPTVLSEERQRRIEKLARAAVDALGLEDCGTHTEIKLQADGGLCLLESAARFGGSMILRLVEEAFGVDLIGLLLGTLLGDRPAALPDRMLTAGSTGRSAASLMVMAADAAGRPWQTHPPYRPDRVDWARLVTAGTEVEVVGGRRGEPMPAFSPTSGTLNYAGTLVLTAADPMVLLGDCYRIIDGLEGALNADLAVGAAR